MNSNLEVLIIGAGTGSLCLAHGLVTSGLNVASITTGFCRLNARMTDAELLTALEQLKALIVHCSRPRKGDEGTNGLLFPADLRKATDICANQSKELCCSVVWSRMPCRRRPSSQPVTSRAAVLDPPAV